MLTIVTEELEGFELDGELEVEEVTEGEDIVTPQLFVHALGSTCSHQTMRVRESKGTRTLFLLIDSGSSHNFLDKKISKQLGCEKENIPTLNVAAANGNQFVCNEVCRKFQWGMQGYQFEADFYILSLDNYSDIGNTMVGRTW